MADPVIAPAWCSYPEPERPVVGCWSLLGGRIRSEKDCTTCECLIRPLPAPPGGGDA